jgi:DNA (cytosine-5)-methyltransferase 1
VFLHSQRLVLGDAVPVLLDLFSGAGGAATGYYRAGFEVVGVDIEPQPRFPKFCRFIQADAMEILNGPLDEYDAVHASPPCQAYSDAMKHFATGYPELIEPVLSRLQQVDIPWVVENVPGSPLITGDTLFGDHGLLLCGSMFGLRVQRHRLFQTSVSVDPPRKCDHSQVVMNPHNSQARRKWRDILGDGVAIERTWREEMQVGWMNGPEGREAIPPVYTQHIGYFLRNKS